MALEFTLVPLQHDESVAAEGVAAEGADGECDADDNNQEDIVLHSNDN